MCYLRCECIGSTAMSALSSASRPSLSFNHFVLDRFPGSCECYNVSQSEVPFPLLDCDLYLYLYSLVAGYAHSSRKFTERAAKIDSDNRQYIAKTLQTHHQHIANKSEHCLNMSALWCDHLDTQGTD